METHMEPVNQVSHKLNLCHGQNYCCFQIQSYSLCWFPPRLASLFQPLLVVGCAHTQPFLDKITLLFVGLDLSIKQVEKESHWLKCSFYCGPQWVCNTTLWDWLRKLLLNSRKILFGHSRFPRVRFSARIDLEFWLAPCVLYQSSDWLLVLYT